MIRTFIFGLALLASMPGIASDKQKIEETVTSPDGTVVERTTTIKGEVVKVEPGRTIVIRNPDGAQVTYKLQENMQLPADVAIGTHVVLATEPMGTASVVTRVTRETAPDGSTTTTEERTTKGAAGGVATETVTTTYTVKAYEPRKSVTLVGPDGSAVSFELTAESQVPGEMVPGKTVTVETSTEGGKKVVRRVVLTEK